MFARIPSKVQSSQKDDRVKDSADLYVRMYEEPPIKKFEGTYNDVGTLTYIPNSLYGVSYTSFGTGTFTKITLVLGNGLIATYYNDLLHEPSKAVATKIHTCTGCPARSIAE